MPILGPDLTCQMLAQRVLAVRPKIVVEIPEPRFQHMATNPDLGGSGAQLLCRALPGRIAIDRDVKALQPFRQTNGPEVTRRECRPDGQTWDCLGQGQHGLDAFADDEDVILRGQPDGIAEKVTHSPTLWIHCRLPLSVRRQPGAMHALHGPCPIGNRGDHRRSGDAPGPTLFPMPAHLVEA